LFPYRGMTESDRALPCVLRPEIDLLQLHTGVGSNGLKMDKDGDIWTV